MPSVSFYSPLARRTYFYPINNTLIRAAQTISGHGCNSDYANAFKMRSAPSVLVVEQSGTAPESEPRLTKRHQQSSYSTINPCSNQQ
jgi:hypothetical protein